MVRKMNFYFITFFIPFESRLFSYPIDILFSFKLNSLHFDTFFREQDLILSYSFLSKCILI